MATVNLGAIKFNWKGAFNNSTAYAVDDVVSSSGNSYVCILASQGNAVSNGTYWNLMAQAGTNGTNLATTLTTRGDIVFRNASTLARLAKGTAGQVLGQGANDPAWVNGSSSTLTTQGDVLYRNGSGLARLAKGSASQTLKMNSAANAPEWVTVAAAANPFATGLFHIAHQTADGTNGGTATGGAWRARPINTIKTNQISGSLSSNNFVLPAGSYICIGNSFLTNVNMGQTRIIDVATDNVLVLGNNIYTEGYAGGHSVINGRFTISGNKTCELQYFTSASYSNTGLGFAGSTTGLVNQFADLMFWKI